MEKENNEGTQTTSVLDQALKDGQSTFDGQTPPDGAAVPLAPGNTDPDEGKEEKARAEAEAAKAAGKKDGEGAPENKEGDTPPGTAPRFKTHEEAERGYRELQGKTTKAEQRAKDLAEELDRIKNADRLRAEAEAEREKVIDYAAERRAQALEAIDELDPEKPDYRKEAAKILSKADIDIYEHYQQRGTKPPADEGAAAEKGTGDQAAAAGAAAGQDPEMEKVVGFIQEKIAGEGLEKDDPLFWQYAGQAPITDKQGRPTKLEDQIRWAVEQTKQYHERIQAKRTKEEEDRAAEETRRRQSAEIPLGRGTAGAGAPAAGGKPAAEEAKPLSLSDAIDLAQERRRL